MTHKDDRGPRVAYEKPRLLDVEQPELLPCPFCGRPARLFRSTFHDGGYFERCAQVECTSPTCRAKGYFAHECDEQDAVDEIAIAAWNRRANE